MQHHEHDHEREEEMDRVRVRVGGTMESASADDRRARAPMALANGRCDSIGYVCTMY